MASMSDEDVSRVAEALAPRLVDQVRKGHHDFWIDPESHYADHQKIKDFSNEEMYELRGLIKMFKATKGIFFKAFIGFAILGAIILSAIGLSGKT